MRLYTAHFIYLTNLIFIIKLEIWDWALFVVISFQRHFNSNNIIATGLQLSHRVKAVHLLHLQRLTKALLPAVVSLFAILKPNLMNVIYSLSQGRIAPACQDVSGRLRRRPRTQATTSVLLHKQNKVLFSVSHLDMPAFICQSSR